MGGLVAGAGVLAMPRLGLGQAGGGRLVMAQVQQPPSLDPGVTSAPGARNVYFHIYELLFTRDEAGGIIPELALSVDTSPDFREFRFRLREGVRFHNGKELTAADAIASLNRYKQYGLTTALMSPVSAMEATGRYEFVVRCAQEHRSFLFHLSSPRALAGIIPEEEAGKPRNGITPIGTGPFRLAEMRGDSHVLLQRFAEYSTMPGADGPSGFGGQKVANFEQVMIRFIAEDGARAAGLQAGEVHVVETIPTTVARRLARQSRVKVHEALPYAMQLIRFNHATQMGGRPEFRRAVMAALNCEEIMAIAHDGLYQLDHAYVFPNSPFYSEVGKDKYNKRDQTSARRLLREAGYDGQPLTFIVDNGKGNNETAVIAAQHMRAVGINVDLRVADYPTTSDANRRADESWHFWTHFSGAEPYEGPLSVMALYSGPFARHVGRTDAYDIIADRLANAADDAVTRAAFEDFQRTAYQEANMLKIGNLGLAQATHRDLLGFKPFRMPRAWGLRFA